MRPGQTCLQQQCPRQALVNAAGKAPHVESVPNRPCDLSICFSKLELLQTLMDMLNGGCLQLLAF